MATRTQIARLAERIDALAARFAPPPRAPAERWIVDGDRAYQLEKPDEVISATDLEARPCAGLRIVRVVVHPARCEARP
jgi:hypothetical protein